MLMKKLLLYILIGGILLIGTYGCANYEEDLLDEISPKQMLATVTTEIELADAVYHRDTVLDPVRGKIIICLEDSASRERFAEF